MQSETTELGPDFASVADEFPSLQAEGPEHKCEAGCCQKVIDASLLWHGLLTREAGSSKVTLWWLG